MRAFASSFSAWKSLEKQEGIKVPHGLVFPLAVVAEIGRPHGLELVAEESCEDGPDSFDAVMISVLDSRCMASAASHFAKWKLPFRRRDRAPVGKHPLVWCGGQGLHNPLPMAEVFDLCVIGDAEDPLPRLLELWEMHGNSAGFLAAASEVPGVFVPAHHNPRETTIVQSVASDITTTLRTDISVSHDGTRRMEIARGCRYKCTFCSLGWRTPVRENKGEDVVAAIRLSRKRVHLQAGDAESHSEIDVIRSTLRAHGGHDQGWTGRLDSLFENPDQTVPGQKRYAFGVEGVSYRLRQAVGKGYLTDERLIADTCRFFDTIEGDGKGRAAWHVISGLPSERREDVLDLLRVVQEIDRRRQGTVARNLSIHWQPFQPLPGTPMQWCAAGHGARKMASLMRGAEGLPWCRLRQVGGRTDEMCLITTVLCRSDERGADLLEALAVGKVSAEAAAQIAGVGYDALDPDAPLPWDFVRQHYDRETLRRAYDVMMRRLLPVQLRSGAAAVARSRVKTASGKKNGENADGGID